MRVDFDSPLPERGGKPVDVALGPPSDAAPARNALLLLALISFMLAGTAGLLQLNPERPSVPVRGPFPFTERDSLVSCGRGQGSISECLASEARLRPEAAALWDARPAEVLKFCRNATSLSQPVGQLYTCLAANADASDLRR